MSEHTIAAPAVPRRTNTMTAHIAVSCEADLSDPFTRFAVFRALAEQLRAGPLVVHTPHGTATADVGLVAAVA